MERVGSRSALDFFATHEPGLEKIRNDIGGHFGYKAALHSIQDMNRAADGCIRVRLDYGQHTGAIWYEFAGEIAATGMERQKLPTETSQAFFARTFQLLSDCFAHALKGTDLVAVVYTIDRFR